LSVLTNSWATFQELGKTEYLDIVVSGPGRVSGTTGRGEVVSLSKTQKVLFSVAAVGGAAGLAGLGTFAAFTDTDSGTQEMRSFGQRNWRVRMR
jgi:predicted ribosomally synthesized peptide with SipW-like signal peptide